MERDNLFLDSENRIILEETVAEFWLSDIKKQLTRILRILPLFKNSVLWHLPRMRRLIQLTETRLGPRKVRVGPCQFVDFLCELQALPGIDRDLRFLVWVFQCPQRTARVLTLKCPVGI